MIKIGNIEIEHIALGPMAGVTDMAFRILCKEMGAGLLYTEMVSGKGILYNNRNTEELLMVDESERPVALQLFGCEPDTMAKAAKQIKHRNFDILDINMGCPVPKVVNNGEGSALMKNPELIEKIVRSVSEAVEKPVSVKIRKGFKKTDDTAVECAEAAERGGAKLIAIHGRTREDYYSGKADWDVIRRVKRAVSVPVIGNGDIFKPEDALKMIEETGADGVMVARGAQGNPWIFKRISHYLKTGEILPEPDLYERVEIALRHARMEIRYKGELTAMREMRKHVAWYMAGFPGAAELRAKVNFVESYNELEKLLRLYLH